MKNYKVEAWPWCADYCKKNQWNPHDSYFWDKAMLEYRRQKNIFEVGDRIVIDGKYDKTFMPVLTILDEGKNYYYCDDGQVHKHLINQWRHATPEEIKAGKRL